MLGFSQSLIAKLSLQVAEWKVRDEKLNEIKFNFAKYILPRLNIVGKVHPSIVYSYFKSQNIEWYP